MILTNSYQLVKETKMGSWGYGTIYLRTYAKVNSQSAETNKSSVSIQSRVYNNGTYCWSGNCYNTLMGEKKKNNVRVDFTGKAEVTLGTVTKEYTHDDAGNKSVSLTNSFSCYALDGTFKADATVDLPVINRKDTATGLDFDIGSSTIITITRYNSSFTRTVVATLGSFSETIMEKSQETQKTWSPTASDLYNQLPNSNTGIIKLTTTTYNGDTVIGTTESELKCRVVDSNPVVDAVSIVASNVVTGLADNLLVRYVTLPKFTITATPKNGASISKYEVTELNSTTLTSTSNVITATEPVKNNSFIITVTDSRGNTGSLEVASDNFIPYFLRAISGAKVVRVGESLNKVEATIDGVWYNELLGSKQNTMQILYRYKIAGGDYSEYKELTSTSQASNFSFTAELEETFDADKVYSIQFRLDDYLGSATLEVPLAKAIPLTDHWNEDGKDYYNINAEIQQNGKSIVKPLNYLAVQLTGNTAHSVAAAWGNAKVKLNKIATQIGDKLTFENNSIKVGAGVKYLKVSGSAMLSGIANHMYIYVTHNSTAILGGYYRATNTSYWGEVTTPSLIIEVSEGDIIALEYGAQVTGSVTVAGGAYTYLMAEVIE